MIRIHTLCTATKLSPCICSRSVGLDICFQAYFMIHFVGRLSPVCWELCQRLLHACVLGIVRPRTFQACDAFSCLQICQQCDIWSSGGHLLGSPCSHYRCGNALILLLTSPINFGRVSCNLLGLWNCDRRFYACTLESGLFVGLHRSMNTSVLAAGSFKRPTSTDQGLIGQRLCCRADSTCPWPMEAVHGEHSRTDVTTTIPKASPLLRCRCTDTSRGQVHKEDGTAVESEPANSWRHNAWDPCILHIDCAEHSTGHCHHSQHAKNCLKPPSLQACPEPQNCEYTEECLGIQ